MDRARLQQHSRTHCVEISCTRQQDRVARSDSLLVQDEFLDNIILELAVMHKSHLSRGA